MASVIPDIILENDLDGADSDKEIIKITPGQKTSIVSDFNETGRKILGVKAFIKKKFIYRRSRRICQGYFR